FRDGANIVVRATRPGHDGYQVVEHTIAPDGSKKVVQYAYDSGGSMVHEDPKT
ncbi:MAG: hypothetical protein QOF01_3317, partial [Thermomicrobiales bacterium]|nr:hypothetical protein [Thermomicrobiales bacterium]